MESVGDIATVTVHIKKSVRRSSLIHPTRSISRRYGVLGIGLRCDVGQPELVK